MLHHELASEVHQKEAVKCDRSAPLKSLKLLWLAGRCADLLMQVRSIALETESMKIVREESRKPVCSAGRGEIGRKKGKKAKKQRINYIAALKIQAGRPFKYGDDTKLWLQWTAHPIQYSILQPFKIDLRNAYTLQERLTFRHIVHSLSRKE